MIATDESTRVSSSTAIAYWSVRAAGAAVAPRGTGSPSSPARPSSRPARTGTTSSDRARQRPARPRCAAKSRTVLLQEPGARRRDRTASRLRQYRLEHSFEIRTSVRLHPWAKPPDPTRAPRPLRPPARRGRCAAAARVFAAAGDTTQTSMQELIEATGLAGGRPVPLLREQGAAADPDLRPARWSRCWSRRRDRRLARIRRDEQLRGSSALWSRT